MTVAVILEGRIGETWFRPEHVRTSLSGGTGQWTLLTSENALLICCCCDCTASS